MSKVDIYIKIKDKSYTYPWFIKKYKNRAIITDKDLNTLLGLDFDFKKENIKDIIFRRDWNALGQGSIRKEFEEDNNVYYKDETFFFVYLPGFFKILKFLANENRIYISKVENILMQFI